MKTILMTAYAVNPFKGSEDGMGWNFILQSATNNKVIAFTRKNNRPHIEKFQTENTDERYSNIKFQYFDWPKWMIFWKKGPLLSLIYFYFWQLSLALKIIISKLEFDIAHNLNFHNDWTPTFLWITGKPFVWGPVGHHPKINKKHLQFYGIKALITDRFLWCLKTIFWNVDPFLWLSKKKASHILCMNEDAAEKLKLKKYDYSICPSVATEDASIKDCLKSDFTIISAGRFVSLKGFDITIQTFAKFYHNLSDADKLKAKLHLVGSGPFESKLKQLAKDLNVFEKITFTSWIQREELQKLYATSSAFLFPSYEGAGMVVAEAMCHALPVLCWDNSGPGAFVSKFSSLKVKLTLTTNDAVQQFANNLDRLFTDKDYYNFESTISRVRFEENFQWEHKSKHFDKIYDYVYATHYSSYISNLKINE